MSIRTRAMRTASGSVIALIGAVGFGLAPAAHAASSSAASLDWSSFKAVTTDPGFAFIVDPSYGTTVTAYTQNFVASLTAPVSAGDPATGLAASGNATTLAASIATVPGPAYAARSADATRAADFTLDNGASVTFSINATVMTNDAADPLTSSFASLAVLGGDLGYQLSSFNLVANGSSQSQTGTLGFTVTNTSGAAITGYFAAEATVNLDSVAAVPEPSTAWLMLPGLLLGGLAISRRRSASN